jgi:hypothetical protein
LFDTHILLVEAGRFLGETRDGVDQFLRRPRVERLRVLRDEGLGDPARLVGRDASPPKRVVHVL